MEDWPGKAKRATNASNLSSSKAKDQTLLGQVAACEMLGKAAMLTTMEKEVVSAPYESIDEKYDKGSTVRLPLQDSVSNFCDPLVFAILLACGKFSAYASTAVKYEQHDMTQKFSGSDLAMVCGANNLAFHDCVAALLKPELLTTEIVGALLERILIGYWHLHPSRLDHLRSLGTADHPCYSYLHDAKFARRKQMIEAIAGQGRHAAFRQQISNGPW